MESLCRMEIHQEIATVTLQRESAANAMSLDLLKELHDAVQILSSSSAVRAVIITGCGHKAFCAGADLKERKDMDESQVRMAVGMIRGTIQAVADLPMPVIAALNGVALGGGLELALACDFRIAAKSALMGLPETGLAIIPGAGGTQRLPRLIGVNKAKELIYTGRRVDADEALQMGLVNAVVEGSELMTQARGFAEEISKNGPLAVRQAKFVIEQGMNADLHTGLRIEQKAYEIIIPTEDRREGLRAFAEKRLPKYLGR
jgi:methylglutaconyl-CoA hydratase